MNFGHSLPQCILALAGVKRYGCDLLRCPSLCMPNERSMNSIEKAAAQNSVVVDCCCDVVFWHLEGHPAAPVLLGSRDKQQALVCQSAACCNELPIVEWAEGDLHGHHQTCSALRDASDPCDKQINQND